MKLIFALLSVLLSALLPCVTTVAFAASAPIAGQTSLFPLECGSYELSAPVVAVIKGPMPAMIVRLARGTRSETELRIGLPMGLTPAGSTSWMAGRVTVERRKAPFKLEGRVQGKFEAFLGDEASALTAAIKPLKLGRCH